MANETTLSQASGVYKWGTQAVLRQIDGKVVSARSATVYGGIKQNGLIDFRRLPVYKTPYLVPYYDKKRVQNM